MYLPTFPYSIRLKGVLVRLDTPLVMGIVNVTPDSFFSGSRAASALEVVDKAGQMFEEGASIVDVGGCSTRPGCPYAGEQEEADRLFPALEALQDAFPSSFFSVDTFRASVAVEAVEKYGVSMVNDISGGADRRMFAAIARLQVPYVLTDNPSEGEAGDAVSVLRRMAGRLLELRQAGVNDVVADPGFGFGKTLDENYALLRNLPDIEVGLQLPLMVGISRKSMIFKLLDTSPENALNGTTALNMAALDRGARILRVHDVRQAVECVRIYSKLY